MALTITPVKQDIRHGGTNNDTFTDRSLTFVEKTYDEDDPSIVTDEKIVSSQTTEELIDEDTDDPYLSITDARATKLKANEALVDGDLEVNGNTVLNGNLTVKGTHTEEHSQDLYVGSDTVTLRDGASTALENGEYSGVLINKYDGTDSLGVVTDNTGTLRVGELNLVYVYTTTDSTDPKYGHYYEEPELETEVTIPSGKTVIIESEDPQTNLAKGYYIAKDDTQAVATRDETSDFINDGIPYYDKTVQKLKSTSVNKETLENLAENLTNISGDDKISVFQDMTVVDTVNANDTTGCTLNGDYYLSFPVYEIDGVYMRSYTSGYDEKTYKYFAIDTDTNKVRTLIKDYYNYISNDSISLLQQVDVVYRGGGTTIELNNDNKIYTFNSVADYISHASEVPDKATVHIKNDINGASLDIADIIQQGNHNVVTSDAVFNYLSNWTEQIAGHYEVNNWVLTRVNS